jgi:asparagine synthase (glutamine-hydrolysing)
VFRYVALVWNDADPVAREEARRLGAALLSTGESWQAAVNLPGLAVHHIGAQSGASTARLLHGRQGVVLGTLFSLHGGNVSSPAPASFDGEETQLILVSQCLRLIESYWGRYVAFVRDATSDVNWVLRDPSGTLPALEAKLGQVTLYFSWMEDGFRLGADARTVNWPYIAAALCQTRVQVHETALANVTQVLGGECIEWRRGHARRSFYWDPLRIAAADVFDDLSRATDWLRSVTRDCVRAWTSGHQSILHTLSGGLDSSIVLACMQDAPSRPRITCLNYHSPGSNTDEREFARLAATRAGCELIERERNSHLDLSQMLKLDRSAIPQSYLPYLESTRNETELAAVTGASASFSGIGGDQLFYQSRAYFAAADYLQRSGIRPGTFGVALNAARMDRLSVWTVLRRALLHGLMRHPWSVRDEPALHKTLIRNDVIDEVALQTRTNGRFIHPLFRSTPGAQSGKVWHAWQLLFPPDFYNPLAGAAVPESVTPLYSQPLMELVLRIPTYFLTIGGWDRAVARRAFQQDVPREIITRQAKGGQEEHARALLSRNIGFVRELLLDGALVSQRILDRDRLEDVLSGRPTRSPTGNAELYEYIGAEAWLRRCAAL